MAQRQLNQFHVQVSQLPTGFNFEDESFDIKNIYMHYALKVSGSLFNFIKA